MTLLRTSSRWRVAGTVTILLLTAIATGVARADEPNAGANASGPTLPGRPLAARVAAPPAVRELQAQLDAYRAAGFADCEERYEAHKAQAWINFAAYAAQNAVAAPVAAAALDHAGESLRALAGADAADRGAAGAVDAAGAEDRGAAGAADRAAGSGGSGGLRAAQELPGAAHVRDDLWREVAAVKRDGRVCGEPKMTAYCEVQLAWVGYEAAEGGWRHVDPYVRIAEDYCVAASRAMRLPYPPRAVDALPVDPGDFRLVAIEAPPIEPQRIDVSVFVLFPHDRSAPGDIRAPGRTELKRVARLLKALPKDMIIEVVGHADVTGKMGYNRALSERRARTVAGELSSLGVPRARIRLAAMGSSQPVVKCAPARERAAQRRYLACLEPNRRVVVQLVDDTEPRTRAAANGGP